MEKKMNEQRSDFSIDACVDCGQFHRVAWYDIEGNERLMCDACLRNYDIYTQSIKEIRKQRKVSS